MAAESAETITLKWLLPDDSTVQLPALPCRRLRSQSSRRRRTQRQLSNEAGSINDLIRKHPRERLFVKPLRWTATHLALLDCHFVRQVARQHGYDSPHTAQDSLPPETCKMLFRSMIRTRLPCYREVRAIDLLGSYRMGAITDRLNFSFAGQVVCQLPCTVFALIPSLNADADGQNEPASLSQKPSLRTWIPRLAYLDADSIARYRHDSLCPRTCIQPEQMSCGRRLARLQLMLPHYDPYIVAVLIALAQRAHGLASRSDGEEPIQVCRPHRIRTHIFSAPFFCFRAVSSRESTHER
ncbi:hypothetical protein QBC46DRAFT_399337 [Diplogelasinospora grovesii]|uniref:Uncharacterized protein n=1 Tax=Diplogelasinospora grovesii TaxID=303347 RepID=A0AAN6MYM9_9PEZI|nr:hypothetical protein QBC46DRAFT_399337 [Diplogelasinospora grovesii]